MFKTKDWDTRRYRKNKCFLCLEDAGFITGQVIYVNGALIMP